MCWYVCGAFSRPPLCLSGPDDKVPKKKGPFCMVLAAGDKQIKFIFRQKEAYKTIFQSGDIFNDFLN